MLIVDCPLCERPAPFDAEHGRARLRRLRRPPRARGRPTRSPCPSPPDAPGRETRRCPAASPSAGYCLGLFAHRGVPARTREADCPWTSASTPPSWSARSSFFSIGYLSVPAFANASAPGRAEPAGRAVGVRARPARGDLRLRPHLGRPLQPGRDDRDGARQAHDADGRGRLHPVADHRRDRGRGRRRASRSARQAVKAGITAPGKGISDVGALIIEIVATASFLAVILAATKRDAGARGAGDPADARRDPLRDRDAERRVGQPGTLARVRHRRRRPVEDLDLHRRPDRRRHPGLAGVAPHRRWRGDLPGRAAGRGGGRLSVS